MRILVTGGSGYLGSAAVAALRVRGHEVVTIGRHPKTDAAVCDLTDRDAVRVAVRAVGECAAVVHLAARAHNFGGVSLDDLLLANTTTTRNLVDAVQAEGVIETVRFVHASSVSVYEVLGTASGLTAAQAPYAASKLQAEQLLYAQPFRSLCVLRFAPIYDSTHLQDVAKRVFLPGTRVKLRLCPPPVHSLCSLHRAVEAIVGSVEAKTPERYLANVTDAMPINQWELCEWFPGRALPVPSVLLRLLAGVIGLCGARGHALSRSIRKFTASSIYPDAGTLPTVSGS